MSRASRLTSLAALGILAAMPATGRAQYAPDAPAASAVRQQFLTDLDSTQAKFVALAEAIPADKYSWHPMPGVRSVGEVFKHVASEYYMTADVHEHLGQLIAYSRMIGVVPPWSK